MVNKVTESELRNKFIQELNVRLNTPEDAILILQRYHFEGSLLESLNFMANNSDFDSNRGEFFHTLNIIL